MVHDRHTKWLYLNRNFRAVALEHTSSDTESRIHLLVVYTMKIKHRFTNLFYTFDVITVMSRFLEGVA